MENVLYNELIRRGCSVDVGVVPIVTVNGQGRHEMRLHEIDFVVNRPPPNYISNLPSKLTRRR